MSAFKMYLSKDLILKVNGICSAGHVGVSERTPSDTHQPTQQSHLRLRNDLSMRISIWYLRHNGMLTYGFGIISLFV